MIWRIARTATRAGGQPSGTAWQWPGKLFLLFLILVLADLVRQIPMPALVAVMVMVSIGTFSWHSLRDLRVHPKSSSFVMLATVAVTVVMPTAGVSD